MNRPEIAGVRQWIYAARIKGKYQSIHRASGILLHAILFITPWLSLGGHPMLRLDLPGRRLYALGQIFTPSDTIFLVLIGLFLAFALFFFTALYGRLWCGYLCPQTVFLEEWIRRIEEKIEGDRASRMARDRLPYTMDAKGFDKVWRKGLKWTGFAAVAGLLSMTVMSYFSGAPALWTGEAGQVSYALTGALGAVLFADFAWFREQFCNYLCPYARFQGALTDEESLVIAYDVRRGEPRRSLFRAAKAKGEPLPKEGACVSCDKCVSVCPQGIDIREGFQLECITCGRCIDACSSVMEKFNMEPLVHYTTIAESEGRSPRVLRPRTVAYSALLLGIATAFVALMANRHDFEVAVNRAPGSLYTVDADGGLRNTYLLRVTNNSPEGLTGPFQLHITGLPSDAEVITTPLTINPTEQVTVPLIVRVPAGEVIPRALPITVHVEAPFDRVSVHTTFMSGGSVTPES